MRKMLKELLCVLGTLLLAWFAGASVGVFARFIVWSVQFGWNAMGKFLTF